ncbi:MAG TPA: glycosyltransferase family 39 protein [Xanthobacteraceae bacterium]|nr:glycosyltransferase family 39 protein [Xanthobacteraceae bacterium]
MTVTQPNPTEAGLSTRGGPRWLEAARRAVESGREGRIVAAVLAAFVIVWLAFHTVSLWPVDLRNDAAEAALWAQHFAFGYKHPPMTAWLFMAWFAVFPRADWAMHLNAVLLSAITLLLAWRTARDQLDKNKALLGLAALILIPLYTFKTAELNASTAMLPFWAAALLFYLRARRGHGTVDSLLAGACASASMLGKYWTVYLLAGMAVAAFGGPGTRRFWGSRAPYLMAAAAIVVIAPHLYWYATHAGGADYAFLRQSVMTTDSLGTALERSIRYLLGTIAYAAGPLVLLALLRPSKAALADTLWPAEEERRQALILFAVPLVLPALVNLVSPYRLTADWSLPNWTLLPIVLYGSRKLAVDAYAAAVAGLLALAVSLGFLAASPIIAAAHLRAGLDSNRPTSQELARAARTLTGKPVALYWGSPDVTGNLPFYVPGADPLMGDPISARNRADVIRRGLLIACLDADAACRKTQSAVAAQPGVKAAGLTVTRTFLGLSGPPVAMHITALPGR